MTTFNWFAVIFLSMCPLAIIGMAAVLIRDAYRKRRRAKRLRRTIDDWQQLSVNK